MSPRTDPVPAAALDASPTAIETVFDTLVADIMRGTYPPGSRLPAERELSRLLGASRPTLREALRRLSEWNLVSARRGSGIVVREMREWTLEAVPAYLRHARPGPGRPAIAALAADVLLLRRGLLVDTLRLFGSRIPAGGTAAARAHAERAWQARDDGATFATEDFQIIRSLAEAAEALPAVWMVNRVARVYLDIARTLSGAITPPAEYPEVYGRVFDHIDRGDTDAAVSELDSYLVRHDEKLLALLRGMT